MDLLSLNSLPIMRQRTSLSPNTGDPVVLTPFLFWHYFLVCVISLTFLRLRLVFHMHIPKVGSHKEGRKVGGTELGAPPLDLPAPDTSLLFSP